MLKTYLKTSFIILFKEEQRMKNIIFISASVFFFFFNVLINIVNVYVIHLGQ